ncbi:MAG: PAS domain S-box protein, partial [Lutibacter sp.]
MISDLKNTDLFQSIFQSSAEGILVVDSDGSVLMANPACEKLFGYVFEELIGKNIGVLIPEKLKQQHKKDEINNPVKYTNVWGIKNDNTQFYLEISLSPTVIDDKNVTIAFLKDATKHKENLQKIKQTDKDLVESNRKFDTLVNNLKGILFRCKNNRDYEMDYISEGCLEITGYPVEAFKTQTITLGQVILDEDHDYVWKHIQSAVRLKKVFSIEYRIKHKDGSIKYVWEKGEAVYNNQNEVMALEGFIADITLQKEAELELRSNEEKMKALLEAIPDMMFIQDHKGVYLDWYVNSSEKLSIPPEKFMGVNMKKVLPPNIYQKIKSSHNKAIESGKMQITEYNVHGKKGIEYREARVVLMNDHSLLTIVRNITGKKVTDAQLNIKNNAL